MVNPQDKPSTEPAPLFHSNERLMAFSDGVFAITITLLLLEVKVPEITSTPIAELPSALWHLIPKILGHLISFIVLGMYWVAHHNLFAHIRRHDHVLLWLNILLLLCTASIPFPTGLLGEYPDAQISVVLYAAVLALTGIAMLLIWWYATTHRLVEESIDPEFVDFVYRYVRIAPISYIVAILASFLSLSLSKFIFIAVVVFYIIPKPFHRHHYRQLSQRFDQ